MKGGQTEHCLAPGEDTQIASACKSGYTLARMKYEIVLALEAVQDLKRLKAHSRTAVRGAIERFLRHEPTKTSRSRIKRLSGVSKPQFRLRVENVRVFYDVSERRVEILAIVSKADADSWLKKAGDKS